MIAILKYLGGKYFTLVQFTLFDLVELGESCKMTDKNLSKNLMVVYQKRDCLLRMSILNTGAEQKPILVTVLQ